VIPRGRRRRWPKVRDRITAAVRAAVEDALAGDGLIFSGRMSTEVKGSVGGRAWWPRSSAWIATRCHQSQSVELLCRAGWLVTRKKSGVIRRTGSIAQLTPHARELLTVSLFCAGLFVTAEELAGFSQRRREEAAVWADAAMLGRAAEATFYWIEVLRRSPFELRPALQRLFFHEEWNRKRAAQLAREAIPEVTSTVREVRAG